MKQIQNIVPQNTTSRKSHYSAPTRRPDPASGAQIQDQIPPSKQNTKQREARKPPQRQGAQKSARRVEATQESIPYLTLRARTEHRVVVSSPPARGCRVPCLPARAGSPRGPGGKEASRTGTGTGGGGWRRVWDGKEEGGSGGPSGFYPRRAPLLFITMAGHRSTAPPPPLLASPLALRPRLGPCLPVCLPLAASPLFLPAF